MNCKEIDLKLSSDMSEIKDRIVNVIPNVSSIYLCGSYGRDEGAWYADDQGSWKPFNDYDLTVITDSKVSKTTLEVLRKGLALDLQLPWVDIEVKRPSEVMHLKSTIKNCDFVYASKLIYGENLIEEIPDADKPSIKEIGIGDIIRLYFTRMWPFWGITSSKERNATQSAEFRYQLAKAILATIDAQLVRDEKYICSYVERAEYFIQKYCNTPEKKEAVQFAIQNKLHPDFNPITNEEALQLYNSAMSYYKKSFYDALGRKSVFFSHPRLTKLYLFRPSNLAKMLILKYIKHSDKFWRGNIIMLGQNYLLHAYSENGLNQKWLRKALKIYNAETGQGLCSDDWYLITSKFAEWRNS